MPSLISPHTKYDLKRINDIKLVIRMPKYFSRAVVSLVSIGICLEWPIHKMHGRMLLKMTDEERSLLIL